jgi:hypothetical protein
MNSNINEKCLYGIKYVYKKARIMKLKIFPILVKRAGVNMRCTGKKYRKKEHWFDDECMEKNWNERGLKEI